MTTALSPCPTCGGSRVVSIRWGLVGWQPETCPDCRNTCPAPAKHTRLMAQREQTWRERQPSVAGVCGWCDGETPASVADVDLRAELAAEAAEYAWLERLER